MAGTALQSNTITASSGGLRLLVLSVFGGAIPISLFAVSRDPGSGWWWLPLLVAVYSAWQLAKNMSHSEFGFIDFCFWTFCYIWFGIAPATQLWTGQMPNTTPGVDLGFFPETMAVVVVGIAVYQSVRNIALRKKDTSANQDNSRKSRNYTTNFARPLVFCGTAYAALVMYIQQVGWDTVFLNRERKYLTLLSAGQDLKSFAVLFSLAWAPSLLAAIWFAKNDRLSMGKRIFLSAFAAMPALIAANPISNGRYLSMCVYAGLAVSVFYRPTTNFYRTTKLSLLAGILTLFPLLNSFKSSAYNRKNGFLFQEFMGNGDYDALFQITNGIEMVKRTGGLVSQQLLGPFVFFIPRSWWINKPEDTGALLAQSKGYGFTNLSAPMWVEGYISFSWLGVVALLALFGVAAARLDKVAVSVSLGYVPASLYSLILLRGSLLQATGSLFILWVCHEFLRVREQPRPSVSYLHSRYESQELDRR